MEILSAKMKGKFQKNNCRNYILENDTRNTFKILKEWDFKSTKKPHTFTIGIIEKPQMFSRNKKELIR